MRLCRGFSLVELMVVVAILGIVASISIPLFNEYRLRSNDAMALADARNLISVFEGAR